MKEKLTAEQLAKLLDCTPKTLAIYKKEGIIKSRLRTYTLDNVTEVVRHLRSVASGKFTGEGKSEVALLIQKQLLLRRQRENEVAAGNLINKDEEYKKDFQAARTIRDNIFNAVERMRVHLDHTQYVKLKTEITETLSALAGDE